MSTETVDVDALLAGAQLPQRSVAICTRGDLTKEAQRIELELQETQIGASGGRLVGRARSAELAQEMADLREKMKAATVEFNLQAMDSPTWRALKAQHPIGPDPSPTDGVVGADAQALFNDAVPKSILSVTTADGVVHEYDAKWRTYVETKMPDGEWNKLLDAVYVLNEEGTRLPFSSLASEILQTLSGASESPETSE